jgi:SAM-dependent methyltransferase
MADDGLIRYYADIHKSKAYGNTSIKNARFIRPDIKLLGPKSVIDYGCGQSVLIDSLGLGPDIVKRRYDPAIAEYSAKPDGVFDLLLNIDVLEHIPEGDLDPVIEEMRSLCRNAILIVDTVPARLILPNGENAHAKIKPKEWWKEKLGRHFPLLVPIRAARSWRAAFRTWERPAEQDAAFSAMRRAEDMQYYRARAGQLFDRLVHGKKKA